MPTIDWSLKITKCSNGFLVTDLSDDEMDHGIYVIEESEKENYELETGLKLLWHIIEFFNLQGSKHDSVRLKVSLEKS